MYYDELIETEDFQLSHLQNADRLYFNCAHALTSSDVEVLDSIENYFTERNLPPAIYLDCESPADLKQKLLDRRYAEIAEEAENWYGFNLNKEKDKILAQFETDTKKIPNEDFILFNPSEDPSLLNAFLMVNGIANNISDLTMEKLKFNLLNPKDLSIKFVCCIALKDSKPASTGLIGLYDEYAFFAEGATYSDFRQQGLYTKLRKNCILFTFKMKCSKIIVNCDWNAFSNQTYQRLGFEKMPQRQLYRKSSHAKD